MLDFIQEQGDEYEGEKRSIINLSVLFSVILGIIQLYSQRLENMILILSNFTN